MQYGMPVLELYDMNKLGSPLWHNTEQGLLCQVSTQEISLLQGDIVPYQQEQTEDLQPTLH